MGSPKWNYGLVVLYFELEGLSRGVSQKIENNTQYITAGGLSIDEGVSKPEGVGHGG